MKSNTVDYLYGLVKLAYPNDADTVFTEKLDDVLQFYMYKFDLFPDKKNPKYWHCGLFGEKNIENLPHDLFHQKEYCKNIFHKIFHKCETIFVQEKDTKDTIQDLLNRDDKIVLQQFNEVCQKIKNTIQINAQTKLQESRTRERKQNESARGEYYLEYNYDKPSIINPKKICLVHATKFYPEKNSDGKYVIETTAHATEYLLARPTIHFTCNHIVGSHLGGNWDDMPYVIMAPLQDIMKLNGKPRRFSAVDTYFLPDPDIGVIMPETVMIVEPSDKLPSGKLFQITANNHCYYRNNNFSPEMERTLTKSQFCDQSLLTRSNKQKYLCALSRGVATEALMGQNGFDYLHGGSIMSNNKIMEEYAFSGQNIGIESVSHQYVHASDNETWLTDSYDLTPAAIYLAEKGEKIPKYAVNTLKKWLEDHIIDGEPIKKLNISETDSPQITKTKTQYNKAVEKLKAKLKAEIKTESDISAYLEKLEFYRD